MAESTKSKNNAVIEDKADSKDSKESTANAATDTNAENAGDGTWPTKVDKEDQISATGSILASAV